MTKKRKKISKVFIGLGLGILLMAIFFYTFMFLYPKSQVIEFREGNLVVFPGEILDQLNYDYATLDTEYFYCLAGEKVEEEIRITELVEVELLNQTEEWVSTKEKIPCQFENSIGSIHSHLKKFQRVRNMCSPTKGDIFAFGEFTNPEPLIFIIQCDINKFYILEDTTRLEEQRPLDFKSLNWVVER